MPSWDVSFCFYYSNSRDVWQVIIHRSGCGFFCISENAFALWSACVYNGTETSLGESNLAAVSFPRKGVSGYERIWHDTISCRGNRLYSRDNQKEITAQLLAEWAVWKNKPKTTERCRHRTFLPMPIISKAPCFDKGAFYMRRKYCVAYTMIIQKLANRYSRKDPTVKSRMPTFCVG